MRFKKLLLLMCVLFLAVPASFAKNKKGAIHGQVTGEGVGPLAGVRVYLLRSSDRTPLGEAVTTDYAGRFDITGVSPGTYKLRLAAGGWQEKVLDGLQVRAEATTSADAELIPAPPEFLSPAPSSQLHNRSNDWSYTFGDVDIREMPTNRTVWSLLENQGLPTVSQTLDNGQLETGTPARFGIRGDSWTENQYLLNGFDASDPYVTGQPLLDPDYAALSSVTEVIEAKPANLGTSGTNLLIDLRQPGTAWHGQAGLFYSGRALESDNLTASLLADNFPGPERLNSLYDANAQIGGGIPLGSHALPFFAALSTQRLSKDLGGFDAPINAHADHILVELTPYHSGGRRLDLFYSGQQEFNSRDGALFVIAPAATQIRNDNFHQFQARWRDVLGPKSQWQAGFGVVHGILSSGLENGPLWTSTLDLVVATSRFPPVPFLTTSGSAPLAQSGLRTRYQGNAMFATILSGFGSHALGFGADIAGNMMTNRWSALNNLGQVTLNGAGSEVIEWNTPGVASQALQNFSVFAQDAWRPPFWSRWLQIPMGLRLDYSTGSAAGVNNRITWTTIEPRVGVVISFPRIPDMAVRAGWSRYGHQLQGQYFDYGNPAAIGGRIFSWDDSNHDGMAQPGEIGQLLRVFGGPFSGIAPGLKRPYTDEINIGIEGHMGVHWQGRIRGFLRYDRHLVQAIDTGVPLSDYTATVLNDPGIAFFGADAPYRMVTVYNEMPAALGHDFVTLENPSGYNANAKGFDLEIGYRSGHRLELYASFTEGATLAFTFPPSASVFSNDTGVLNLLGNDPNTQVNNPGLTYFDRGRLAKLQVYYNFPWQIHAAAVVRWSDGVPFSPPLLVTGFNQGPFFVRAVPDQYHPGFHAEFDSTVDLRISRKFAVPRGSIEADLDFFNLLNSGSITLERDLSDAALLDRLPLAAESPRTARLGVEWRF